MTSKVSSRGANLAELLCFLGGYSDANSSGIIHHPFGRSFKCNQTGPGAADLAGPAAPAWTRPKAERAEEGTMCTHAQTSAALNSADFLACITNRDLRMKAALFSTGSRMESM